MAERAILGIAKLKIAVAVSGILVVSLVGAFAFGVLGAPSVEGVENRFGDVDDEHTVIETDLVVDNPNPIGIQLGGTTVNYTVNMNEVSMAEGGRTGLSIERGNSTLPFETRMDNEAIPSWWTSHVDDGERTTVSINATVRTSILGEREFDITQEREVETDIIGEFNSDEVREVNVDDPPPTASNPILFINRTGAQWGPVTEDETPIDMEFDVHNPQLEPYVVTEVGYEITMNEVRVGEGATEETYVIPGGGTETLDTRAVIRNQQLDDWWVTHLQNDQVTDLKIEFYARIELPTGNEIRVPLDELTYEETIETDIFDTKNDSREDGETTPTPDSADDTSGGTATPTETPDDGETETPTPTPTETDDDTLL